MRQIQNRRTLVAGLAAAVAAFTTSARPMGAQSASSGFSPARHDADRWMDELRGKHRVFVDSASRSGGQDAVLFANTLFSTNETAYGLGPSDLAIIVCFRHASTPYGYNDAMWAKYGSLLSQRLELAQPATANPLNPGGSGGGAGRTLGSLIEKGAHVAICANATRAMSGRIASSTGASQEAVFKELTANAVKNGRFVPAGVVAATRAQEYGYSLLSCG